MSLSQLRIVAKREGDFAPYLREGILCDLFAYGLDVKEASFSLTHVDIIYNGEISPEARERIAEYGTLQDFGRIIDLQKESHRQLPADFKSRQNRQNA